MFKLLLFILLVLLIKDVAGCIPMRIVDPITIPVTTTLFPPLSCPTRPGQAAIYIEDGVVLNDDADFPKTDPTGSCINATGVITYYNGETVAVWLNSGGDRVFVGNWIRNTCTNPCVCTATACYTPMPANPSTDPNIFLYPHCITPGNCYVALTFNSNGAIVNVMNPADMYSSFAQDASGTGDVTDPEYPRITRIGCSRCPL